MLLGESDGYKIFTLDKREIKRTHSLIIDDLKTYQENHKKLKMANDIIVQATMDSRAIYGVKKRVEINLKSDYIYNCRYCKKK